MAAPAGVHAVRPLDTEDTGIVELGAAEVETSLDLARHRNDSAFGSRLVVAVGVLPRLEARVEAAVVAVDRPGAAASAGAGESVVGFKYRLKDDSDQTPAVLLATAVHLPTGDEDRGLGEADPAVIALVAVSRSCGPLRLTANAGYTWAIAGRTDDSVLAALAVEHQVAARWTLLGELVRVFSAGDQPDRLTARLGAAWRIRERLRLDGALATGLAQGSADLIVTVGATLRF